MRVLSRYMTVTVLVAFAPILFNKWAFAHPDHVDHTDAEIDHMSMEQLLHVEHDLRQQNKDVDKRIASLHGHLTHLKADQRTLEARWRHVGAAKAFEVRQRLAREAALSRAEAAVEAKRAELANRTADLARLRTRVQETWAAAAAMRTDSARLQDRLAHPRLTTALMHSAAKVGPVPLALANRTVTALVERPPPALIAALSTIRARTEHTQRASSSSSPDSSSYASNSFSVPLLAVIVLLIIVFALHTTITIVTAGAAKYRAAGSARAICAGDVALAFVWSLAAFTAQLCNYCSPIGEQSSCYGYHCPYFATLPALLLLLSVACAAVLLRCAAVAAESTASAGLELFIAVLVAQDFYQRIWLSAVLNSSPSRGPHVIAFLTYALVHVGLAVRRARELASTKANPSPPSRGEIRNEGLERDFGALPMSVSNCGEWMRERVERALHVVEDALCDAESEDADEKVATSV